ncbi:MAG: tryptophan synthase subunit alpha [Candidatus Omnitrophota bacterium]
MTRIDKKFRDLRRQHKKAFIAFITAGDPDLNTTFKLALELEKSGVDIIELGVPFSDPLADGPVIQAASERSLKKGTTLVGVINLIKRIRRESNIPLVIMSYYNPILSMGEERFTIEAHLAGLDGLIIPDLPPEESSSLISFCRSHNLNNILFLSPTSPISRIKSITRLTSGFIYYVSLTGVTGTRDRLAGQLENRIRLIKRFSKKPVCVGFGISNRNQVQKISRFSDGVIIGSAIVKKIQDNVGNKYLVTKVGKFVRSLM